jgi:signal peptidase I
MSAVAPSNSTPSDRAPRRSRVLAGVLSFFAPGSGHVYIGQYRRGMLLLLAFVLLQPVLLLAGFLVAPTFRAVMVFGIAILVASLVVVILIVIDAIRQARRSEGSARWYVWVGAIALCWGGFYAATLLGDAIKPQLPWRTFTIPSASMEPTLHVDEWLIADMRHYDRQAPARGDLVLYRLPSDNATIYIKRIVGLPGDNIAFRDGHAVVNGASTNEPFANFGDPHAFFNNTAGVTVPPDQLFVAGDNRANSLDSRAQKHGMVPMSNVIGRAAEIFLTEDLARLGLWVGSPKS